MRGDPLLGPADPAEVDAVEEHGELTALQPCPERALAEGWESKTALLEALVEEDEATVVPGEHLRPVAAAADEDEEVAGVEVFLPLVADDAGEPVDAVAHVDGLGGEKNPDRPREEQHEGRLPERPEQLADVTRLGPRREPDEDATGEGNLDRRPRPRHRRGRAYDFERHEGLGNLGCRFGVPLGLPVHPVLKGAERQVVLGAELLLLQSALLVLGQQRDPLLGTRSSGHGPDSAGPPGPLKASIVGRLRVCGHAGIRELAAKVCGAGPKELRCGTVQGQGPTYGGATLPDASPCCEYACPQGQ